MNELSSILQQGHEYYLQHQTLDVLTRAVPAGIALLVVGIGLSVLGAKFARFGTTGLAVLVGGAAGVYFARNNDFPPVLGALTGGLLVGIIGYQTFRVWVGVGTALVVALIATSVFGQKELRPYLAEFDPTALQTDENGKTEFAIPSLAEQQARSNANPGAYLAQFSEYLADRSPSTLHNWRAVTIVALLTGLCVGLIATRWALILSTSLVGTLLVAVGAATLLVQSVPKSCLAFDKNPGLAAAGLAGFLITSFILQALLSKRAESAESE